MVQKILKGKAKSKGKGKGPPGGCHECGGDHYARECETRKIRINAERALQESKGKGKGKGGKAGAYSSIPPRFWSGYNPGFMQGQWNQWRPGSNQAYGKGAGFKGKGKGENQIGSMMQSFSFPPLGAVNFAQEENLASTTEDACEPCNWSDGSQQLSWSGI